MQAGTNNSVNARRTRRLYPTTLTLLGEKLLDGLWGAAPQSGEGVRDEARQHLGIPGRRLVEAEPLADLGAMPLRGATIPPVVGATPVFREFCTLSGASGKNVRLFGTVVLLRVEAYFQNEMGQKEHRS